MINFFKIGFLLYVATLNIIPLFSESISTNASMSFSFIENKGQFPSNIKFYSKNSGYSIIIADEGIYFDYFKIQKPKSYIDALSDNNINNLISRSGNVIKMEFDGNKQHQIITGEGIKLSKRNVLKGNNSDKWITNISEFQNVKISDIYKGVDVIFSFEDNIPRYDFVLKPGASVNDIAIKFSGINSFQVSESGKKIEFEIGNEKIIHSELKTYQIIKGEIVPVESYFEKKGEVINFKVGKYDKNNQLIIDPKVFSSYFGGESDDEIVSSKISKKDKLIIAGRTRSYNLRTTPGAYDTTYYSEIDAFVSVFDLMGADKGIVFSTYIGGNGDEITKAVDVDPDGNIYITGNTDSDDYPLKTPVNAMRNGKLDIFLTKLSSDGTQIIYSTYFGGTKDDNVEDIAVGVTGSAYITGGTYSTDFFSNIIYNNNNETNVGLDEAFVTKFSPSGNLAYSYLITSLGNDYGKAISVNEMMGILVVAGETNNPNIEIFPQMGGNMVLDNIFNGGKDIFIAGFTAGTGKFDFNTFFGGSGDDIVNTLILDSYGDIYLAGETTTMNASINPTAASTDFRITSKSFRRTNSGYGDGFFAKIDRKGTELLASSFIGGKGRDVVSSIAINPVKEEITLTGWTLSDNFPVVNDVTASKYSQKKDVFISTFSLDASKLLVSQYLGGFGDDVPADVSYDSYGGINLTGTTNSNNFPILQGSFQDKFAGENSDGFIYKDVMKSIYFASPQKGGEYCPGDQVYIVWSTSGFEQKHPFNIDISSDNGKTWSELVKNSTTTEYIWQIPKDYPAGNNYRFRVWSQTGLVELNEGTITINELPAIISEKSEPEILEICEGNPVKIIVATKGKGLKYQWFKNNSPLSNKTDSILVFNELSTNDEGQYHLVISGKCNPVAKSQSYNIKVIPKTKVVGGMGDVRVKENSDYIFKPIYSGKNLKYSWQKNGIDLFGSNDSILTLKNINKSSEGKYRVIVTGDCGIDTSLEVTLIVDTLTNSTDWNLTELKDLITVNIDRNNQLIIWNNGKKDLLVDISLFDLFGRKLMEENNLALNSIESNYTFNLNPFYSGIYFLRIQNEGFNKVVKILFKE